jgi:putative glutamine amidotransferase
MSQRPVVGVPTQTLQAIDGIPEGVPHSWVMNHRYFLALTGVGAVPWMIPLLDSDPETIRAIYERLDGVFLAGGVDVDPSCYGATRDALCGNTDLARDRVEMMLARWAIEEGKPLFGVCRGMQVINVVTGGTLVQDCTYVVGADKHDYFPTAGWARDHLAHEVEIAGGSRLERVFGSSRVGVNSMHHQAIQRLGEGLDVTARAPDGVIEAVEGRGDAFLVGVQWHPEMLVDRDPGTHRLFEAFIEAASEYGRTRLLTGVR